VKALRQAGIQVQVYEVNDDMPTPDAIFPNNWFSLHTPPETAGTDACRRRNTVAVHFLELRAMCPVRLFADLHYFRSRMHTG